MIYCTAVLLSELLYSLKRHLKPQLILVSFLIMEQVTNLLIKSSKKHIEYFKKKITPNGIIILQEFHSTSNYEINWKDVLTTADISITEKQILAVLR